MDNWPGATTLMEQLAHSIGAQINPHGYLLDPLRIARLLRIKISFVKSGGLGLHGSLIPVPGGFRSEIYRSHTKHAELSDHELFTIAHECGHAFFYYCDGGTPTRIIPRRLDGKLALSEEGLCNHFARSLLPFLTLQTIPKVKSQVCFLS